MQRLASTTPCADRSGSHEPIAVLRVTDSKDLWAAGLCPRILWTAITRPRRRLSATYRIVSGRSRHLV